MEETLTVRMRTRALIGLITVGIYNKISMCKPCNVGDETTHHSQRND